jgi:uncharacterized protein
MKRFALLVFLMLGFCVANSQSYTVESVPNTKLVNNSYVSNPDNLLSTTAVNQINLLLDSLEKQTTSQVAVVMLNSIGEADVTDFAQSLFVSWKLGQATKDNGLLILYVQDQRTVRFHTGFGLEGALPDAICKRIQTQKMVPFFKGGNTDAGMMAGVEEVSKILTNPTYAEELNAVDEGLGISDQTGLSIFFIFCWFFVGLFLFFSKRKREFSNSKQAPKNFPTANMSSGQWLFFVYLMPMILAVLLAKVERWDVLIGGLYGYFGILTFIKYNRIINVANKWLKKGQYQSVHTFYKQNLSWTDSAVFFPIPLAFLIPSFKRKAETVRAYPRNCHKCDKQMTLLSEAAEDEYLSKEKQYEESLKSVDYDVWKCNNCSAVTVERYPNNKTEYSACPKCRTNAYYTLSTSILRRATTTSKGEEEIIQSCKFCNHRHRALAIVPMIVIASSSSSSDDSSSSWSSSSSDSGGSWGGGDSGGGGASSSW